MENKIPYEVKKQFLESTKIKILKTDKGNFKNENNKMQCLMFKIAKKIYIFSATRHLKRIVRLTNKK